MKTFHRIVINQYLDNIKWKVVFKSVYYDYGKAIEICSGLIEGLKNSIHNPIIDASIENLEFSNNKMFIFIKNQFGNNIFEVIFERDIECTDDDWKKLELIYKSKGLNIK